MRRAGLFLLVCFVFVPARAQEVAALKSKTLKTDAPVAESPARRIASLRSRETREGSRVTVTSDAALGNYTSYQSGDRFIVRIPEAAIAAALASDLQGRGYERAQIERHGADVLLSFKLEAGATAQVKQSFNRLEIFFNAQEQQKQIQAAARKTPRPILRRLLRLPLPEARPAAHPSSHPIPRRAIVHQLRRRSQEQRSRRARDAASRCRRRRPTPFRCRASISRP
jgi:hypothetical protein